jgi:predicted glutamine amidotransferase
MCRLLYIKSRKSFKIGNQLQKFANMAKHSKEYQGHGWGLAYLNNQNWKFYKNLTPIWEDNLSQFGETRLLLAHARSAFRDRDISLQNNMPFHDERHVFIFNGELHGVRINIPGRIGAEKVFNFIKRFDGGDFTKAIEKGVSIIAKRSTYIRAMNFIIADKNMAYVVCHYNEDMDYFTMYYKQSKQELVICSERYDDELGWIPFENKTIRTFK